MVRIAIGTITGFCLVSLLLLSCGAFDDAGSRPTSEPDRTTVTDTLPDPVLQIDAEYLSAAHILITWFTPTRDSVSDTGEVIRIPVYEVSDNEEEALYQIRNIHDEILSGQASFEEMAFNYSHCTTAADSGRLPDFTGGAITEELDSTVAALEPGEISGIIRTRFGYHIIKRLGS